MRRRILILAVIALMVFISIGLIDSSAKGAPLADFTYTPDDPKVDEEIEFDASRSDGEDLEYTWDFGDGHRARGIVVTHTYDKAGEYVVILIVTNSTSGVDSYSENIYVGDEVEGFIVVGIIFAYLLFICGIVFFTVGLSALNFIIGGILAYKVYNRAKENDMMDTAKPYLIAHLISGVIGFFYYPVVLLSIIAHIVIYVKFKNKAQMLEREKKKASKKRKKLVESYKEI